MVCREAFTVHEVDTDWLFESQRRGAGEEPDAMRVLIADDEPDCCAAVVESFARHGIETLAIW